MPLLLMFLGLGMLAGEDGLGGLVFDDVELALLAGSLALAVILFDGGLQTNMGKFRVGLRPAVSLATIGVLVTAGVTALACRLVFELTWLEALLMGSIVASTDAAAVFALLSRRPQALNDRVSSTLEIESGSNDPMAIFLTVLLVELVAADVAPGIEVIWRFVWQMGAGALLGIGGGIAIAFLVNRLTLSAGLYPLLALSGAAVLFGATQLIGASGFLAVYLAGVVVGNRRIQALHNIQRFHDGVAWLAQIGLFLILGLLVSPHELIAIAPQALAISAVLILVARPLAVILGLVPFKFRLREQAFIAWVGLRGAVPIVLAMFPLVAGLDHATLFFNVAFFIVLVSLVAQGATISLAARWSRVEVPIRSSRVQRVELELPGQLEFEIVGYRVADDSPALGSRADAIVPETTARANMVVRGGKLMDPSDAGPLQREDYLYFLARPEDINLLDPMLVAGAAADARGTRKFFGEFELDPAASLTGLAGQYGFEIPEDQPEETVADFLVKKFPTPVVGDRARIGSVEVVVREIEGETITRVGLKI